jgi:hypothetical protein
VVLMDIELAGLVQAASILTSEHLCIYANSDVV